MSLSSTRGLVRVSKNPDCDLQAAMAIDRVKEPEFYRRVTGTEYPGEYGERLSARRRGTKFEADLTQNNAASLRRAVGPTLGYDPDVMVVRNFADEIPGPPTTMRAARLTRMRRILGDLAAGRDVPHLLVQPQLALPTGTGPRQMEFVSPDFMVFDSNLGMYLPGEQKSFIVRDSAGPEPADLDLTRRQAAAQILALRAEADLAGLADRVTNRAAFVMATAYGLRPADPTVEDLDGAVREIQRAIATITRVRDGLAALRLAGHVALENLADELPTHFQENCYQTCILANVCTSQNLGTARTLGDDAGDLLGPDTHLSRIVDLLRGTGLPAPDEQELVEHLRTAGRVLGIEPDQLARRLA